MRVGIFLGRAVPSLHPGHLGLIDRILKENDKLVACIGSAQLDDPPIEKRRQHWKAQIGKLAGKKPFELYEIVDPVPIDTWPDDVARICGISRENKNTFYRADPLEVRYIRRLGDLGIEVKKVRRMPFFYLAPDGLYRRISSSTEVRLILKNVKPREASE